MQTTAYISSNPTRTAEIDAEIEQLGSQIKANETKCRTLSARSPEYRQARRQNTAYEAEIQRLHASRPEKLFCEANALADLEADIAEAIENWKEQRREWSDEARNDPAYAIEHGDDIVAAQTRAAQVVRLRRRWEQLQTAAPRSLATFRQAYDSCAEQRRRDMLSKLTGAQSTSEFYNAVERAQGRALAQLADYSDSILLHLTWYEEAAAKLTPAA